MSEARVTYRGVIYPWQCDAMGHFTTRYYMAAFDEAAWHFLWEAGFDPATIEKEHIGWADVRHEIEYLSELREGDLFQVESRPLKLGNTSVVYEMALKPVGNDTVCARLTATTVQFDLKRRRSVEVLPRVRKRLSAWLSEVRP